MTTTTETPASCPPSAVHDMIVTWDEVREGDLIVWDGEFRAVQWIVPVTECPDARVVLLDGEGTGTIPAGTYAAVRRYDTDEA